MEGGLVCGGMPVERVGIGFEGKEATAHFGYAVAFEGLEPGQIVAAQEFTDRVMVGTGLLCIGEGWNRDRSGLALVNDLHASWAIIGDGPGATVALRKAVGMEEATEPLDGNTDARCGGFLRGATPEAFQCGFKLWRRLYGPDAGRADLGSGRMTPCLGSAQTTGNAALDAAAVLGLVVALAGHRRISRSVRAGLLGT